MIINFLSFYKEKCKNFIHFEKEKAISYFLPEIAKINYYSYLLNIFSIFENKNNFDVSKIDEEAIKIDFDIVYKFLFNSNLHYAFEDEMEFKKEIEIIRMKKDKKFDIIENLITKSMIIPIKKIF